MSSASFSPDGSRVVTASNDDTARVWDVKTGSVLATLYGHTDAVDSAAFSPDGSRIVTASGDKTARVWDAETGAALTTLLGHSGGVGSANFSPDGSRIVTASEDKTARVWNTATGAIVATLMVIRVQFSRRHSAPMVPAASRLHGTRLQECGTLRRVLR